MAQRDDADVVGRRTPAKGVVLSPDMPLILWCTVCADEEGVTWVAQEKVMRRLEEIWRDSAAPWLVGEFVLMPDHMHFFCCPRRLGDGIQVENWVKYWKAMFSRHMDQRDWRWERGLFHTRIRSDAHYQDRLHYLQQNPVKAGLVQNWQDWPWRGCVNDLTAHNRSLGQPKNTTAPQGE